MVKIIVAIYKKKEIILISRIFLQYFDFTNFFYFSGHIEIVKLFIPFTYAKNIPLEDHRGNTPFDLSAKEGHTDIAKLLLRQMIDNSKRPERELHDYLKFLHHTYTVDGRHDIASLILGPNHLQH